MSYKLADGTLSTDYKYGDKFKVVKNEHSCCETTVGEIVILSVDDYTVSPYFTAEDGSGSGERVCYWEELEKYEESSLPTYTPEQLSEIDQLRDRVDMLESLCSEYVEQIKDIEYSLDAHKKALNMFAKLTVLLSENHKVADLVGAQIGDDVINKIYDYLLSQVEQKTEFKPISEMTIEDWQQALEEGWLFEDNEEDTCQVEGVDKEMQLIEFDEYIGKFDIHGDYTGGHPYYITKRIK